MFAIWSVTALNWCQSDSFLPFHRMAPVNSIIKKDTDLDKSIIKALYMGIIISYNKSLCSNCLG